MFGDTFVIHLPPDDTLYLTKGEVGRLVQLLQRDQPPDPLLSHLDWDEAVTLAAELQAVLDDSFPHHDWATEGFLG